MDLALLLLWCRPAATALIRPLAWEPPYAKGMALKRQKKKKKKKKKRKERTILMLEDISKGFCEFVQKDTFYQSTVCP